MAGFDYSTFISGPAIVTYNSLTYYTQGDITVRAIIETWPVKSSMYGTIDNRIKSKQYEITFVPVGEVETISTVFPYSASSIGTSIFGADKALTIQTLAGQLYTFPRAAMTKMPTLNLGTGKTAFGEMRFLSLLKTSTEITTADAMLTIASQAFSNTSFDETKITSPGYTAAFGTSPYDVMESVDGFTVEIGMEIKPKYVDRYGMVDAQLTALIPTARFTPVGLTEAQYDALVLPDGASALVPGQSIGNAGTSLVISKAATYLKVTLAKAGIMGYGFNYGEAPRLGELVFGSKWTWTTGAVNAPFTVEIQAA